MGPAESPINFCGESVSAEQLALIGEVIDRYPNLSRTELAGTICELLDWTRANGKPKIVECRQWLERLEEQSRIELPKPRVGRPPGSRTRVVQTKAGADTTPIKGSLSDLRPVQLKRVESAAERALWRELIERYHYLGHRVAFGAHLRYLIRAEGPPSRVLGCVQFSSPAWRMAARDRWIGWNDATRQAHLLHVVGNSRYLILPHVAVPHLASHALALAARALVRDWPAHYGVMPWLVETLVDAERFAGTCYRAANWIEVGVTSGRGRADTRHQRHGAHRKTVWVYPLRQDARQRLCAI